MIKTNSKQGSVILPVLLLIMVIASVAGTYLNLSFSEFKMAYRNEDLQGSINLAEGGIEMAMDAMRSEDWTGWSTVATDHYYQEFSSINLGNGRSGKVTVFCSILDSAAPFIYAEGRIESKYGNISKQIKLDLSIKGLFVNGLTAKDSVTFSGNNTKVDSYNSNFGAYNAATNRNDKGSVGSTAISVGSVSVQNADIWGYVVTGGGAPTIGPSGTIKGETTPSGVKVDSTRIATDFYAEFENISAPTPSTFISTLPTSGTIGITGASTPIYYKISDLDIKSTDALNIDGPVVIIVDGDVGNKGSINITSNGSVELYFGGNLDIGGNGIANMSNIPENLLLVGTNTTEGATTVKIAGNGALTAAVYAPNSHLELKGSGSSGVFQGAAIAYDIKLTGNFEFHYDEALADYSMDASYKINRWRELVDYDERAPMSSGADMMVFAYSGSP